MSTGLGVDLHPYYQRGVTSLPGVEYGWLKMADGAHVYSKRADGRIWTADAHAALFRRLGIPFGGYVYAQPGDGAAEARVLWAECQRLGGTGVAPGCDIESDPKIHIWSNAEAKDHGRAYCAQMRQLGVRPAVYMNASLAQATRPDLWPENPVVWVARYGLKPEIRKNSVQYTGRYDIHQYRSDGALPGSAGAVDWNQAYTTTHLTSTTEDDMPSVNDLLTASVGKRANGTDVSLKDAIANLYLGGFYGGGDAGPGAVFPTVNAVNAKLDALTAAVAKLATNPAITPDALGAMLNDAIAERIQITGTVQVTGTAK